MFDAVGTAWTHHLPFPATGRSFSLLLCVAAGVRRRVCRAHARHADARAP